MQRRLLMLGLLTAVLCARAVSAGAQGAARSFSIFIDCPDSYCDPDFYRTELAFVDHVRDRTAADVHVLITSESTGGGGRKYSLAFYGQRRFAGVTDTLPATTPQGTTEDEQRKTLVKAVRLGLVRYLARTADGERVAVTLEAPKATATKAVETKDPWNAWVFRVGTNLDGYEEESFKSRHVNGDFRADRITERWKTRLRVNEYYNEQQFDVDGEKVTTIRRDYGGTALQVRSLGEHWSIGGRFGASSSTYQNQKLAINISPAIEYDLYPYKESTRRQLIAQYSIGARSFRYIDTTVFFKIRETKPFESLALGYQQKQPWGSIDLGASAYHYLDDPKKYKVNLSVGAEVRLAKGLNLNSYVFYAVIRDQLYLPKGALSRDEVLLQQSRLQTGYSANYHISLSYTFGSVLNNIVNPRFNIDGNDF